MPFVGFSAGDLTPFASALSEQLADAYVDYMAQYVGRENVYPMNIRSTGAVHVE